MNGHREDSMRVAVTGCASGIGAAVARTLRANGATVVGFDIAERAEDVDRFIRVDLADPASIGSALDQIDGTFDALCNVAALPPRSGAAHARAVLAVNFLGTRRFTDGFLGHLDPGAAIVTVASRAGQFWRENIDQVRDLMTLDGPEQVADFCNRQGVDDGVRAYDLSKEALIAWTQALSEPLAAIGLRANTVSPGAVSTPILEDFVTAFGERAKSQIARVGRPASAEEIAGVVAFLAMPDSGWIKGADIPVDGGAGAFAASDKFGLSGLVGPRTQEEGQHG